MENKKFCFIICTDNPVFLEECVHYLQHLAVPKGYDMDLLTVKDAVSMALGYQEAMEQSDAKYKIYMHQDVFILNRNFLADLLAVFEDDPEIGMIGMVGYEKMSGDGIMWHQKRIEDCALPPAGMSMRRWWTDFCWQHNTIFRGMRRFSQGLIFMTPSSVWNF